MGMTFKIHAYTTAVGIHLKRIFLTPRICSNCPWHVGVHPRCVSAFRHTSTSYDALPSTFHVVIYSYNGMDLYCQSRVGLWMLWRCNEAYKWANSCQEYSSSSLCDYIGMEATEAPSHHHSTQFVDCIYLFLGICYFVSTLFATLSAPTRLYALQTRSQYSSCIQRRAYRRWKC